VKTLNQLGIQFNRAGTLEFDQKKFNAELGRRPNDVQEFFVGDGFSTGFISSVRRELGSLTNPGFGPLANRTRGLEGQIRQMDERIAAKERQISKREDMLRNKFAKLEETMNKIKSQGAVASAVAGGGGGVTSLLG
jgi:flagellar hook-associated protein 2